MVFLNKSTYTIMEHNVGSVSVTSVLDGYLKLQYCAVVTVHDK